MKKIKILLCVLLTLVFMAVMALFLYSEFQRIEIEFTIDRTEYEVFDTDAQPPVIHAYAYGGLLNREKEEIEFTSEGSIDLMHTGIYTIKVKAGYLSAASEETFEIHVKDSVAPVITLKEDAEHFTLPNEEYAEDGFTAYDNYDGDITSKVTKVVTKDTVFYDVEDSAGNIAHAERIIRYNDPEAPSIKLKGKKTVKIEQYAKYQDKGATAYDNVDGNLTGSIVVSSNVNTDEIGEYKVVYKVTDAYGNTAKKKRKVIVTERSHIPNCELEEQGKIVYLTFDDGPGAYTSKLLDVLDRYNVKATFFVVNTGRPDLIKREYESGHTVAVHSYTHEYKIYSSMETYYEDFKKAQDMIFEITGSRPNIVRFPGGSSNTISARYCKGIMSQLVEDFEKKGIYYFDWNVTSGDAESKPITSEQLYRNVINGISRNNVSVVLQHDIKGFSVDAVEDIIIWGLENGYTFLPLDETSFGSHHPIAN